MRFIHFTPSAIPIMPIRLLMAIASLSLIPLSGCSPETVESAKKDFDRNTKTVRESAKEIEEKAKPVIEAAKPVTDIVKREADRKVEQLKIGARVTAALKANENLPETIRVDAAPDAKRVTLRGTVTTAKQKALAEKIARQTIGEGKNVQNDLVIGKAPKQETE